MQYASANWSSTSLNVSVSSAMSIFPSRGVRRRMISSSGSFSQTLFAFVNHIFFYLS